MSLRNWKLILNPTKSRTKQQLPIPMNPMSLQNAITKLLQVWFDPLLKMYYLFSGLKPLTGLAISRTACLTLHLTEKPRLRLSLIQGPLSLTSVPSSPSVLFIYLKKNVQLDPSWLPGHLNDILFAIRNPVTCSVCISHLNGR